MLVIALAHNEEIIARRRMERSLDRLSAIAQSLRNVAGWNTSPSNAARWERAIVAFREHRHAYAHAERRHSMWYRAYLRARCSR